MLLIQPPLLEGREYFFASALALFILFLSLSLEYKHYKQLTQFDDAIVEVEVLKHYTKNREGEFYDVLKMRLEEGATFYMTSRAPLKNLVGYRSRVWLLTEDIDFLSYLKGFVTRAKILSISRQKSEKFEFARDLRETHKNEKIAEIYGALFYAIALPHTLQQHFSTLGLSHLLAISGFHLGVLSFILYTLLYFPYTEAQKRWFPYRHRNRDIFLIVALLLGFYLLFLGEVASLMRAYTMLLVGYFLHDRGFKVVSIQTLLVSLITLLVLWPRLFFMMGFWLSVSGVYFIFLYLHYFSSGSKIVHMVLISIWVYLMMTPVSLVLFGNYSLYHPLSIIWSLLFTLFYPLALLLHLIGYGQLLDGLLQYLLAVDTKGVTFAISTWWLLPYMGLAVGAYFSKLLFYGLFLVALGVSIAAIYQVA